MKTVIPTIGSRGDVQPFIALTQGLARAGHAVTLASHPIMRTLVEVHGVTFAPIGPNIDLGQKVADIRLRSRHVVEGFTSARLNLVPVSPAVYAPNPHWAPHHHVVGYWFADAPVGWQPPAELLAFLEKGERVVNVQPAHPGTSTTPATHQKKETAMTSDHQNPVPRENALSWKDHWVQQLDGKGGRISHPAQYRPIHLPPLRQFHGHRCLDLQGRRQDVVRLELRLRPGTTPRQPRAAAQ